MGFSVSGSAALVFAGMFIAFGMWHTAASNGFERVSESQQDRTDDALAQQNTDIAIVNASYGTTVVDNGTTTYYNLDVNVTNDGTTTLALDRTEVLLDNDYRGYGAWAGDATVDGVTATGLWAPGETLAIEFNESTAPGRVQVTTEHGVGDSSEVTPA